jgi:hypothetical protein
MGVSVAGMLRKTNVEEAPFHEKERYTDLNSHVPCSLPYKPYARTNVNELALSN